MHHKALCGQWEFSLQVDKSQYTYFKVFSEMGVLFLRNLDIELLKSLLPFFLGQLGFEIRGVIVMGNDLLVGSCTC